MCIERIALEPILTPSQTRHLAEVFGRGAMNASDALSRWLGKAVRLTVSAVDQVAIEEVSELLGPGDTLVAACSMTLTGILGGELILVFGDRSGLALGDLLLGRPPGTATSWDELERSAAMETANIVGCAYLNALSESLPSKGELSAKLAPAPPLFRHEFAASLLQFAMMDQAFVTDRLLLIRTVFETEESQLDWALLFVPAGDALATLRELFAGSENETP